MLLDFNYVLLFKIRVYFYARSQRTVTRSDPLYVQV